ncbi:radical SAM protein [Methanomicrobium antiquum]|uniref:Radical SAM protein n=1 Tax=Methanomicrobium antiquum TaxID=487686 RepID=A0AAF0JKP0_9EURY|nr:radical SAM protein [Methanomicrobium antiquum]WFN35754.1 radical SAM protein [Methanomicrobium antiquum]
MEYKYLFGPVPSRRLGISLGIDLVPPKTCSYNCIYCECGKTTNLTITRKEYFPTDNIIEELDDALEKHPHLDYITYSGSGEPTLHTGIKEITKFLKKKYPEYKIALLTNGSMFWDENVRKECLGIDLVIPSLDSSVDETFKKIDRPHRELKIDKVNNGIIKFSQEFSGTIWLEIFIVPGINDTISEIEKMNEVIKKIKPEKVQLNTLDRPGVVSWIKPASDDSLKHISSLITHKNVEIAKKPAERLSSEAFYGDVSELILNTIKRRPCTLEDISEITALHINEINKYLGVLVEKGLISESSGKRGVFYSAKEK